MFFTIVEMEDENLESRSERCDLEIRYNGIELSGRSERCGLCGRC